EQSERTADAAGRDATEDGERTHNERLRRPAPLVINLQGRHDGRAAELPHGGAVFDGAGQPLRAALCSDPGRIHAGAAEAGRGLGGPAGGSGSIAGSAALCLRNHLPFAGERHGAVAAAARAGAGGADRRSPLDTVNSRLVLPGGHPPYRGDGRAGDGRLDLALRPRVLVE
ncbi:hypothetical protein THAOC_08740, partial [Thalassiosira oceanica]